MMLIIIHTSIIFVQRRKQEEEVESDGPRLNEKITADTVRLVSAEGTTFITKFLSG